ncbi:MAG: RNA pseudouridine synthase, partial [Firmicutes bacterium]|nr:RNA pseudouridine synthase [Bacillota bacterium]
RIAVQEGGREAISHVYPLCNFQDSSLLRVELKTGRTHQIRAHMSHLGYPLVGDPLYGGKNKKLDLIGWKGQALHARLLELAHPRTGEKMRFVAPLPPEFKRLLSFLRDESQL